MRKGNYQLLIEKLDQFIRKYYLNQLIKGTLYTLATMLVLFVSFNLLEHYFYFDTTVRKLLFFSFIGLSGAAFVAWIGIPLAKYFHLGSVISHERAAQIIGQHFGDVEDKLLNVLQLKQQADQSAENSLILAGIDQKSDDIKLVPFRNAIDLGQNRQYLRYVLPPLLLLIVILFAAPSLITDSTARLINNGKKYERPAPFQFELVQEDLKVIQNQDFPITVKVDGDVLPNEVFINVDNYQYRLQKEDANTFSYRFNNVQKDTEFRVFSSGVTSEDYELEVLKKPNLLNFEVKLDYPNYIGQRDESLNSVGDLVVPVGTKIDWIFDAQHTDAIDIQFSAAEELTNTKRLGKDAFTFQKRALRGEGYKLYVSNEALPNADSVSYSISVIPDKYPSINVERFVDSTEQKLVYFVGDAADDYGLLSLSFNYEVVNEDGEKGELQSIKLNKPSGNQIQYDHQFDVRELELQPGDQVNYYFEVYDNDGVNGSKSARTNLMQYRVPTVEEYEAMAEENDEQIKEDLKKSLEETRKLQEEMKKMREKLLQKKELDWQDKKELEKLLERQKELEKQMQQAKENFEENKKNQEEFSQQDEEIMQKQEQLQEMMEDVMSEEMQELMKQIQELMEELEKDGALEMMEQMEMQDEEMEMELDRMLELFKELEMEQEMKETIEKLEELAEKQEELAEETEELAEEQEQEDSEQQDGEEEDSEEKDGDKKEGEQEQSEEQQQKQDELEKEQEKLNEEFDKLQEKMEKMQEKNEELSKKKNLDEPQEDMEKIDEQMENSQEQLEQQENKKASKSQKNAAQQMRRAAQKMSQQMQSMQMEQMQEDMQALRQLLENLVGMSFDQEELVDKLSPTDVTTPRYVELVQEQFKLQDDFRLVEDSLQALAKRNFQIESFITEKSTEIKNNIRSSLEDLEERRKPQAAEHQRRSMKNLNDLALMLSETMQQMQQQMSMQMPGQQMCTNPGQGQGKQGTVPKDQMSQGQKQLNQEMKEKMQQMKDGKGGMGSKEFAQMAARQAALRKALKEKQKEMSERGKGSQELQDMIDQMDKVETDLVNKKLTNEMMKRQQDILTRLLEHEKAEREKEYDEQRKAEQANAQPRPIPPSLEEYLKKREAEINPYQTVSPNLKPYYKSLVERYIQSVKSE
jgi:flagellar biosynthesis GTPase FlhF